MIYKHEFIVDEERSKIAMDDLISYRKKRFSAELGEKIGDDFGWEKVDWSDAPRRKIEIAAFPIEKWLKFIEALNQYVRLQDRAEIQKLIVELHSQPKPTNQ